MYKLLNCMLMKRASVSYRYSQNKSFVQGSIRKFCQFYLQFITIQHMKRMWVAPNIFKVTTVLRVKIFFRSRKIFRNDCRKAKRKYSSDILRQTCMWWNFNWQMCLLIFEASLSNQSQEFCFLVRCRKLS